MSWQRSSYCMFSQTTCIQELLGDADIKGFGGFAAGMQVGYIALLGGESTTWPSQSEPTLHVLMLVLTRYTALRP